MFHNLSIVNIIHSDHRDMINELASILGMGDESINIPLTNGYFACHSWWTQEKYNIFKDLSNLRSMGIDVDKYLPALNALHEFVVDTSSFSDEDRNSIPNSNFINALNTMNLEITQPEQEEIQ